MKELFYYLWTAYPKGLYVKSAGILHIIPSGLMPNALKCPINIYSLREFIILKICKTYPSV
jgi:hypothetical protein